MRDIGADFRALHRPGKPFVLANAWDVGSAKVLTAMGAEAIGTTSSGHAFTIGKADMGHVTRDEALAHAQDLVAATHLPVSGDFENGYGDAPEDVAETVRRAGEVGLAGCSVEDTDMGDKGSYDFDLAVERVRAGAATARALGRDFVFVARADGVMNGVYDIEEALRRVRAFDEAGADCLFVPLPATLEDQKRILEVTEKPVNVLAVGPYAGVSRAEFAAMGAARISVGSGLARVAQTAFIHAAKRILGEGEFSDIATAMPGGEIDALLTAQNGE
ncbi:isocitrate lyase/phosphoenolpyruvate mutase family protein [uncultured Roseovarius sp.]|uniref:isocitrate lyase/PEP mutase family protein n=1 Tax=uncultured Roseovarius sp. TaxID=293344 RepID=UPI0025EECE68|nr:isocitrate lyase/phosphoenolpyruvate mutase family protein [uncultured Roseovarius sp.]